MLKVMLSEILLLYVEILVSQNIYVRIVNHINNFLLDLCAFK